MNKRNLVGMALGLLLGAAPAAYAVDTTVNLSGRVTGMVDGSVNITSPAFTSTTAIAGTRSYVSVGTASWTTLSVPPTAVGALIVMPAGNTNTVWIAGTSSISAGEQISLGGNAFFAFLPLVAGQALFASASAATTLALTFF